MVIGIKECSEQKILKPEWRNLICEDITDAWKELKNIIKRSLKAHMLNLKVDGPEDSYIYYFKKKKNQPSVFGYEKLQQQLHMLQDSS